MTPGVFGFSLLFEVLVFYYALHFLWTNVSKAWIYLIAEILIILAMVHLSGAQWADIFSGNWAAFWPHHFH